LSVPVVDLIDPESLTVRYEMNRPCIGIDRCIYIFLIANSEDTVRPPDSAVPHDELLRREKANGALGENETYQNGSREREMIDARFSEPSPRGAAACGGH
jgi:hypothetical protein